VQQQIIAGARTAFLQGDQWAYTAGLAAITIGATLVFFAFPKRHEEQELLARYHAEDVEGAARPVTEAPPLTIPQGGQT
jgi:hypothetical protein